MARPITDEEKAYAQSLLKRARKAQEAIADLDQAAVDRAIQAIGWASANEKTFTRLARMGVEESGLGDWEGPPEQAVQDQGCPAGCPAPEIHGHRRGDSREGAGEICQTRGGCGRPGTDDKSGAHPSRHGYLRPEGKKRRYFLPTPGQSRPPSRR